MRHIGIIGVGFVGGAILNYFKDKIAVFTNDIKHSNNTPFDIMVQNNQFIFICLPTPQRDDGACDTFIVSDVLKRLNEIARLKNVRPIIVIKSTVYPGYTKEATKTFPYLNICFNPEFLKEASANEDFANQKLIVVGSEIPRLRILLEHFYTEWFPDAYYMKTDATTAEMVKYVANSFLATKVTFCNEIYQLCEKLDISYDKLKNICKQDDRLGSTHWDVPGPDKEFGFGGHCFPKDVSALVYKAKELGITPTLLETVLKTNEVYRYSKDT